MRITANQVTLARLVLLLLPVSLLAAPPPGDPSQAMGRGLPAGDPTKTKPPEKPKPQKLVWTERRDVRDGTKPTAGSCDSV